MAALAAATSAALVGLTLPAAAAPSSTGWEPANIFPGGTNIAPAGLVCSFPLMVEQGTNGNITWHDFSDVGGPILGTGHGADTRMTNVDTGAEMVLKGNGAVTRYVTDASPGATTVTMTGHNLLFMFPTDVPPGPSSTLYVGQVVFTAGADGVTTVMKTSGRSVDICAALTP